jgi:hypothetical protein
MILITDFDKSSWDKHGANWLAWAHCTGQPVVVDYGVPNIRGLVDDDVIVIKGKEHSSRLFGIMSSLRTELDSGLWAYSSAGRQLDNTGRNWPKNKLRASTKKSDVAGLVIPIVSLESRAWFGGLLEKEVREKIGAFYTSEFLVGPTNIWDFFHGFFDYSLSSGFVEPHGQVDDLATNLFALMYESYLEPLNEEDNRAAQSLSPPGD